MRVVISVLVALLGSVVGAVIGIAITYALLSGAGVDALVWAVTGIFFSLPLALGGGIATGMLCRRVFPAVFASSRQGLTARGRYGIGGSLVYGICATIAVLVVGPLAAIQLTTRGTSGRDLLAGKLCRKPGIRYIGTAAQGVTVCFTLTADRSARVEIGWRFSLRSGCGGGGATLYDSKSRSTVPDRSTCRASRAQSAARGHQAYSKTQTSVRERRSSGALVARPKWVNPRRFVGIRRRG